MSKSLQEASSEPVAKASPLGKNLRREERGGEEGGSIQSAFELIPRPVLRPQVADQIALSISNYRLPLLPVATSDSINL